MLLKPYITKNYGLKGGLLDATKHVKRAIEMQDNATHELSTMGRTMGFRKEDNDRS